MMYEITVYFFVFVLQKRLEGIQSATRQPLSAASHNHCDECGAPSSANWVSMIFSKSAGGSAPLRKTPFTKNPGVPATPTLRPCSMSASILDLNLPLSRHD